MANYVSNMRTNFFTVNDVAAFEAAVAPFSETVERFKVVRHDDIPNAVALFGEEFLAIEVDVKDEDGFETGESETIHIGNILQAHITDDAAVIGACAGWEADRYIVGTSFLITKNYEEYVSAEQVVKHMALAAGAITAEEFCKLSATN